MKPTNKIAFLFLDEIHHLYHFITVAVELSKTNRVHLLTYVGAPDFLYRSLKRLGGDNVMVEELPTSAFRTLTDFLKKRKLPRKGFWLKKNMGHLLNDFDAVVFTDYFQRYLIESRGNRLFPKTIKLSHGPPGRAYSFREDLLDFDLKLLWGKFVFERLKKLELLGAHYAIVGYPKIDAIPHVPKKDFFGEDKPVVLYNPHFTTPLSSWHKKGLEVLDFFYNQNEYNLIFAPHLHLFQEQKGGGKISDIPEKYLNSENIHFDFGSEESVDMTYVKAADIYLGDVSSQVYEFLLIEPRPCIFINAQNIDYKGDPNYRFWKCGEVVENIEQLPDTFENSKKCFEGKYKHIQEKITSENFYEEENSTPSERAARAIRDFLKETV